MPWVTGTSRERRQINAALFTPSRFPLPNPRGPTASANRLGASVTFKQPGIRTFCAVTVVVLGGALMWLCWPHPSPEPGISGDRNIESRASVTSLSPVSEAAPRVDVTREAATVSRMIEVVGANTRHPVTAARIMRLTGEMLGLTDGSGRFAVEPHMDCVLVEHRDYAPSVAGLEASRSVTRIELSEAHTAHGAVLDQDGNPMQGVTVVVSRGLPASSYRVDSATPADLRRPAVTAKLREGSHQYDLHYIRFGASGKDGTWSIGGLSSGAHTVVGIKAGYAMNLEIEGVQQSAVSVDIPQSSPFSISMARVYVGVLAIESASANLSLDYVASCAPFFMTLPRKVRGVQHAQEYVMDDVNKTLGVDKSFVVNSATGSQRKLHPLVAIARPDSRIQQALAATVGMDVIGQAKPRKEQVAMVPLDEWDAARMSVVSIADVPQPRDVTIVSARSEPSSEVPMCVRWSAQHNRGFVRKFEVLASKDGGECYKIPVGFIMYGPTNPVLLSRDGDGGWQQVFEVTESGGEFRYAPHRRLPCLCISIAGDSAALSSCMVQVTRVLDVGDGPSFSYQVSQSGKRVVACEFGRYRCTVYNHKYDIIKTADVTCTELSPVGAVEFAID